MEKTIVSYQIGVGFDFQPIYVTHEILFEEYKPFYQSVCSTHSKQNNDRTFQMGQNLNGLRIKTHY